jgi:predicted enzyme related to lactoylglutathione lyase
MPSVINWFEIPASNMDRACAFYAAIIGASFQRSPEMPDNAFFDHDEAGVGGEVCKSDDMTPGPGGVRIYLNAPKGVADALARVEAAGGRIVLQKTAIGPHGFIGVIEDTEGNHVGLHNMEG